MFTRARTALARMLAPEHTRRFDAAGGGRRASGFGYFGRTQT